MEQRSVVKERWQVEEARGQRQQEIEKEKRAELWKERESTERVEKRERETEKQER